MLGAPRLATHSDRPDRATAWRLAAHPSSVATVLSLMRSRDALVCQRGLTAAQADALVAVVHDNERAVTAGVPLRAPRLLLYARAFRAARYTPVQTSTLLRGIWTRHAPPNRFRPRESEAGQGAGTEAGVAPAGVADGGREGADVDVRLVALDFFDLDGG
jgi:hypothetical protein